MQHSQFNFVWHGTKGLVFIILVATPALAGTMAQEGKPDPLLDDGSTVPCAARVDYAAGIDVNGNAVVPADVGAQPLPVPPVITTPLSRTAGNAEPQSATGAPSPSGSVSRGARIVLDGRDWSRCSIARPVTDTAANQRRLCHLSDRPACQKGRHARFSGTPGPT